MQLNIGIFYAIQECRREDITRQAYFQGKRNCLDLCTKPQNHTHTKLLIPISWRVAVWPPEWTPPPDALASWDIIDEASDAPVIPEEVKPALWTFWSAISLSDGVESTEALRGSTSLFI